MTNSLLLETFKNSLPQKPYCTDDLSFGLKIRPAETAIKKRYLQYNKPTDLRWFVYDVDRPTAHFDQKKMNGVLRWARQNGCPLTQM